MNSEEKFYFAFYKAKKITLYHNEIKEYVSLSNSSIQSIVKKLREKNIVKISRTKAHTYYTLNIENQFSKNEMKRIFWKFDDEKFQDLNLNVKIPLMEIYSKTSFEIAFVILFGSASQKKEKKGSDIDLLVVSYDNQKKVKSRFEKLKEKINAKSIYPLQVFYCELQNFIKLNDTLLLEAKNKGFPIIGNFLFYDLVLEEWKKEFKIG